MRITEQFVFFHGKQDIYSQWYECAPFEYHGILFKTCEHWMMVRKAIFFAHREKGNLTVKMFKEIIAEEEDFYLTRGRHSVNSIYQMLIAPTPKEVKALGRLVSPFNEAEWGAVVPDVLYKGNYLKFTQNRHALEHFEQQKSKLFVEASIYDRLYGVGMSENDPRIDDPYNWRGENRLGIALTKLNNDMFPSS